MLYRIAAIARGLILPQKDYYTFEPFITRLFNKAEQQGSFTAENHRYKLRLRYMIAHAHYRNRKFTDAWQQLQLLEGELYAHPLPAQSDLPFRTTMLKAALYLFKGELSTSIGQLEQLQKQPTKHLGTEDRYNLLLNLGMYYFLDGNARQASRCNLKIEHTDRWCARKIGREWVMKKNLMEVIMQYELHNEDIALKLVAQIKRQFADLFQQPLYGRVPQFLDLIALFLKDPYEVHSKAYQQQVTNTLTQVPVWREDLQAMAFYCWLKSKITGHTFYETLLSPANNQQ